MNLFKGKLLESDSNLFVDTGEFTVLVNPWIAQNLKGHAGQSVTYGVRPEDVEVSTNESDNSLAFTVFGSELMGSEQFVHAMKGTSSIVARAPMTFSTGIQQKVWMNLSSTNAHVFDSETGNCLA